MNIFQQQYEDHAIHNNYKQLLEKISNAELSDLSEEEVVAIARFQNVIEHTAKLLEASDPELVSTKMLEKLNNTFTSMTQQWNNYCQQRNSDVLVAVADTLLDQSAILPANKRKLSREYSQPLRTLRDKSAEMLKQIRETSHEQDEAIEEQDKQLQSLEGEMKKYSDAFEHQKGRIDSLINTQQEQFSKTQSDKNDKYELFVEELQSTFDEWTEEKTQKAQIIIDALTEHNHHAKEIVGIIGNIGVTGNYQKIANEEKKTANLFRWIATGCFGGMLIAVIIVLIISFFQDGFTWEMALFRVVTALVFAAPGIYCAMESSKHRKREQLNRKIELELASISPFLEKLQDESKSQEILAELAPEYFGNKTIGSAEGDSFSAVNSDMVIKVLKEVGQMVKSLK